MPVRVLRTLGVLVAAAPFGAAAISAAPAHAGPTASGPTACSSDEVTVVVDFNEIGGADAVGCAAAGGTAAQALEEAGFGLGYANAPGMQGFVCTVAGVPTDRPCTQGSSYWSLWWSDGEPTWAYATLGVQQLQVPAGATLGFAWHEGKGAAAPPDVAPTSVPAAAAADTAERATPSSRADGARGEEEGIAPWVGVGAVALVLGAALAVPLRRRRR